MESFDTILDQLKQAQKRGKAAVEGQFENIAARLSQLVDEATASARENLAQEAEDLFPIDEFKQKVEGFRDQLAVEVEAKDQLAAKLADVEARLDDYEAVGEEGEAAIVGPSLSLLRALDEARSQSELLRELLPALCEHAGRAVVIVIRGEDVSAWSGIGFGDGETLRNWRCGSSDSAPLRQLIAGQTPVAFNPNDDEIFAGWLAGEEDASHALVVPVCLRGNLMGCMYLDDGGDGPWAPESAQAMVAVGCWMIDTLHYRQTAPSPMLAEAADLAAPVQVPAEEDVFAEPAPPIEEEAVVEEPAPVEAEEVVEEAAVEEPVVEELPEEIVEEPVEEEAEELVEEEPAPAQEPDFDPSATMRVEVVPDEIVQDATEVAGEPEAIPDAEVEAEPAAAPEPEPEPEYEPEPAAEEETWKAEVTPPPPIEVAPAEDTAAEEDMEAARSPEEEAQHSEAQRFARLLISEIKLYNEEEVERGKVARDIYQRLKEDIDRSREMYERRISDEVRQASSYFDDELVRILADGDSGALGM